MSPQPELRFLVHTACLGLLILSAARPATAQQWGGVSVILAADSSSIVASSATEIDYAAYADGYLPDVAATLEADGNVVATADPHDNLGNGATGNYVTAPDLLDVLTDAINNYACVDLSVETQQPDTYAMVGYHYLWLTWWNPVEQCYEDPGGFNDSGSQFMFGDGGSSEIGGSGEGSDECIAGSEEEAVEFYLGYSAITFSSSIPTISSISPTGGSLGTTLASGATITVYGQNLVPLPGSAYVAETPPTVATTDPTTGLPSSGVSVSVAASPAPTDEQVTLKYSIASNASTGAQDLTLTTYFGTSNPATFTVGDPTPTINSVTPNPWNAGSTNAPFTINGTGFGTSPTVTINGTGLTSYSITSTADTQINGTVTIDPNAPNGTATVQVQSNGYGGSGFLQSTSGQPSQSSAYDVNILAEPVQILWGTDCSTASPIIPPISIVAGQQVTLVACVGTPPVAAASPNWQLPQGIQITAGFTATPTSYNSGQDLGAPPTNQDSLIFYFVGSGGPTVTFNNGPSVNFAVSGPSTPTVTINQGSVGIYTIQQGPLQGGTPAWPAGFGLGLGGLNAPNGIQTPLVGITMQASQQPTSAPPGSYSWVQILNSDSVQAMKQTGQTPVWSTGSVLDGHYPSIDMYTISAQNDSVFDGPYVPTCQWWGELDRSFSATMYLLWTPNNAPNGCTGAACTIPVPLGSVYWHWSGDAINTLLPFLPSGAGYTVTAPGCTSSPAGNFVPGSTYPSWANVSSNTFTCP